MNGAQAFLQDAYLPLLQNIHILITLVVMQQGDNNITKPDVISLEELQQEEKPKKDHTLSPEREDEQSVSGHMPDPESDDDTLSNVHQMGLQRGETFNSKPQELNIERDLDSNIDSPKTR